MRNDNGADFERWMARADKACVSIAGVGIEDLADGNSYDAWDGGASPEEYARERLDEAGFPHAEADAEEAVTASLREVRYGDGSPEAAIASEDVRRANWTPSNQYRNGGYVKSSYAPTNEALVAAIKIRKAGRPMPRLY